MCAGTLLNTIGSDVPLFSISFLIVCDFVATSGSTSNFFLSEDIKVILLIYYKRI
jgi:hypothetical protein